MITTTSAIKYHRVLQKYCEDPKPLKGLLIELLNKRAQHDQLIQFAEQHFILNDVYVGGGVEMFGEFCLVGCLKDNEEGGLLFKLVYLEVGHCSNGDYVVVDIDRKFGEVRYISHEECSAGNEFEDISEYSEVVANSLGDFVAGLDKGTIGSDHFEEIERSGRRKLLSLLSLRVHAKT